MKKLVVLTVGVCLLVAASCSSNGGSAGTATATPSAAPSPSAVASATGATGAELTKLEQAQQKIQHVLFIVQENRSFDHYFGTFPGADGIPMRNRVPTVCVPDPISHRCDRPYHTSSQLQQGGPHAERHSIADVDGGKMDGFVEQAVASPVHCADHRDDPACASYLGPQG